MPLETFLDIEIEPMGDDDAEKLSAFLKKEFGERAYVSSDGFSTDRILAGDDSSGIGHFSEVEELLRKMDEIVPNLKCRGNWQVDFTVDDAAPDSWSFDWSESKVANVVDELAELQQAASSKWDEVFRDSESLKPEMFEHWIYEEACSPRMALEDLERMIKNDPESWVNEPFDDEETVTYGDAVYELKRVLDGEKRDKAVVLDDFVRRYPVPALETVTFGRWGGEDIDWYVLKKEADRTLLISVHGLDCKPFNSKRSGAWKSSDLKAWLEDEFENEAFTAEERESLCDKPFCLTAKEAEKYFADHADRICTPTAYATAQKVLQSGFYVLDGVGSCNWWLRSSGAKSGLIKYVGFDGYVNLTGCAVDCDFVAVRPALWVNLQSE